MLAVGVTVLLLALLGSLLAPSAWAGELVGTDPAGDVASPSGGSSASHATKIDLVGYGVDAGADETRFWLDVPELDPEHPAQYSWSIDHTGDGRGDLFLMVAAAPETVALGRIERSDAGAPTGIERVDCPSLAGELDLASGQVVATMDSTCLDEVGDRFDVRVQSLHRDDQDTSWVDQAPTDDPYTYDGPVVREKPSEPDPEPAAARTTDDSCPEGEVPAGSFGDTDGSTHEAAIDCIVWWELTGGDGSGGYGPAQTVTRAQMATFIARLLDRTERGLAATSSDHFADDDGSPHERSINRLAEAGLVSGGSDGQFHPGAPVSRAQMAAFLVRAHDYALEVASTPQRDHFDDDDGNTHEGSINVIADLGITGGTGDGYGPAGIVRRDQMASFLARTLDVLVEAGEASPPA